PSLHLTLRHNGKDVYEVPASAGLEDRLRLFFGADVADKLYTVETTQGPVRLRGYIADPQCERGTARMQYVFVNGRCIRDRSLMHALQEAYRGLLMAGRYAVAFLFLDLPADEIDVNVHPTKVEVRFRNSQALHHLVFSAIRERLRAENLTARLRAPAFPTAQWTMSSAPAAAMPGAEPTTVLPFPTRTSAAGELPATDFQQALESETKPPNPAESLSPANGHAPTSAVAAALSNTIKAIQLYDAYLVLETQEGMLVIDQHALHERVLFEEFKRRIASGTLEIQKLLMPLPVDLTAEQAARTLEQRDALAELGLGVEDFGGGTVLLTSYPAILGNRPPQEVLKTVVDHLLSKERLPSREVLLNDLLSLMACHAAVRAGDRLSAEEIAALIARRDLAHDTHHCPHGRPTALLFSKQELDRQFRRI
ncbi:MAG TPA: DNA mismatch repair endonuclease MutL, partial [Gemmataceae bacterium]|nr:DNA mismatch repair endonuclease MutL [Gemmataceae bacterium]